MRRLSALFIIVIVGGVVAAAYALHVDRVKVTGLRTLVAADVIRASGVEVGQRILWIHLSAAARKVEEIPGVEKATATRSLPGTVVLHITERRPIAKLGGSLVADANGYIFEAAKPGRVPTLVGWRATKSRRRIDQLSRAGLRAFRGFPYKLKRATLVLKLRPSFTLELRDHIEVRFGRLDQLETKAATALSVLGAEANRQIAYVDVQVPNVPVVGPLVTPPPPTPTPAAVTPATPITPAPAPTPRR